MTTAKAALWLLQDRERRERLVALVLGILIILATPIVAVSSFFRGLFDKPERLGIWMEETYGWTDEQWAILEEEAQVYVIEKEFDEAETAAFWTAVGDLLGARIPPDFVIGEIRAREGAEEVLYAE